MLFQKCNLNIIASAFKMCIHSKCLSRQRDQPCVVKKLGFEKVCGLNMGIWIIYCMVLKNRLSLFLKLQEHAIFY